jgi:predicted nucleic acid-binding protein
MRLITVDSSVFVSAARPSEPGFEESTAFLAQIRRTRPRLFLPTLAIVETATALSRTGNDEDVAQRYAMAVGRLPNTVLVALDEGLARQASELGSRHKLRGADALYVATASLFGAQLVTLDREQLERGAAIVQTLTPSGFVAAT